MADSIVKTGKHRLSRGKILPRVALMFVPFPKNTFCSIDVTTKCNLRCKHCYFFSYDQDGRTDLTDEEWLKIIESMQKGAHPYYSCTWVGGEPLLRKGLIEKGRRYFKANRVVTNGTLPIPDWPDDVLEAAHALGTDRFAVLGVSGGGPYAAVCLQDSPPSERSSHC